MEKLISRWQTENYTEPILYFVLSISLIVALKNSKKHEILKYFPLYISSLLIVCLTNELNNLTYDSNRQIKYFSGVANYLDYSFTFLEMIVFSHFFYRTTKSNIERRIIIFLNTCFLVYFAYMPFTDAKFYHSISEITQSKVYTIEGAILLLICLFHFIEIFKELPTINLKNEPIFWVSTGLLFFLICTLPYSVLENYIDKHYGGVGSSLYSLFYIFYIVLFLMIIRAYLCKPKKILPNSNNQHSSSSNKKDIISISG